MAGFSNAAHRRYRIGVRQKSGLKDISKVEDVGY